MSPAWLQSYSDRRPGARSTLRVQHPPSRLTDMEPDHADLGTSAAHSISGLPRFAVVDIETSGLSTRKMLRGAPPRREVLAALLDRLDGAVFTAHNVRFDWPFIQRAAGQAGLEVTAPPRLCTLRLSRQLDPERQLSHRLADVCERYGVTNQRPHDAVYDARATAAILPHLLQAHGVQSAADLDPLYERR